MSNFAPTPSLKLLSNKELLSRLNVEQITPVKAREYIHNQGPQRNPRWPKIKQYADDMKAGKWEFNSAAIVFDRFGKMRDGQNRMHALIEAGVSLPFIVLRNASEQEIATIDTGMSRTFADVTRMQGIPNATEMAAAASLWWKYENDFMQRQERPSHKQLEDVRDKHLNALGDAIKLLGNAKVARSLAGKSVGIFVIAYLHERDVTIAADFLRALDSGENLQEGDPMWALRRTLINNNARRSKLPPYVLAAFLIKTFNFRYEGKQIRNIMFRSGEEFPKFVI